MCRRSFRTNQPSVQGISTSADQALTDVNQTDLRRSEPSSRVNGSMDEQSMLCGLVLPHEFYEPTSRCQIQLSIGALVPIKPVIPGVAFTDEYASRSVQHADDKRSNTRPTHKCIDQRYVHKPLCCHSHERRCQSHHVPLLFPQKRVAPTQLTADAKHA